MWALIMFMFIQSNLDVQVANARFGGVFSDYAKCEQMALQETKVVTPRAPGLDAQWQYATCVKVR